MTGHYQATKTQKSEDVVLSIEVFFKIIKLRPKTEKCPKIFLKIWFLKIISYF